MSNWALDPISAAVGFACGVLAVLLLHPLGRRLQAIGSGAARKAGTARRRLTSGVEGRFRDEIARYAQSQHFGAGAAPLEAICVPSRLVPPSPEPDPSADSATPRPALPYLWPESLPYVAAKPPPTISLAQLMKSARRAVLLAPAGGGKSTALAYLALMYAQGQGPRSAAERLPILAHLHDLAIQDRRDWGRVRSIEAPLIKALKSRSSTLTMDSVPSLLRSALRAGRAAVLLDGWDELDPSERASHTRWASELVTRYPDNQYVLTAPLDGYGCLQELGFVPLRLATWQQSDVEQLASRWVAALSPVSDAAPPVVRVPDPWQAGSTALDTTLNLWLQMAGEHAPVRRSDRFQRVVHRVLMPLGRGKINWPQELGLQTLGRLAHEMAQQRTRSIARRRVRTIVRQVAASQERKGRGAVKAVWRALDLTAGLLVRRRGGRLAFPTPALYDFCWAVEQARCQDGLELPTGPISPERAAALAFYVEIAGSVPGLEHLLKSPSGVSRDDLFLAASWVPHVQEQPDLARTVLVRLAQLMVDPATQSALRERAVAALVCTQDEGVSYLLRKTLRSPDAGLRAVVAGGLGALACDAPGRRGDGRALEALLQSLQDPADEVRAAALYSLASAKVPAGLEAVVRTLHTADPSTRRAAAEALALAGAEAKEMLEQAASHQDAQVRRAAVYGLTLVDEAWAAERLRVIQRADTDWQVRSAAEELLNTRLHERQAAVLEPIQPHNLGWLIAWAAERGGGVPVGESALVVLRRVLVEGEKPSVRAAAALSLGNLGRADSIEVLASMMQDPDETIREAVFFAGVILSRAWSIPLPDVVG